MNHYSFCGYGANVEWIAPSIGIVRGGNGFSFGNKYTFVCVIVLCGETAVIKGYLGVYDRRIRKCLKTLLVKHGVKSLKYERIKNGNATEYSLSK